MAPTQILALSGKAVLRGQLIQYCSYQKRKESEKILNLEQQLKHLKLQYIQKPDQITWNNMNSVKFEINRILQKKAEFTLFCS